MDVNIMTLRDLFDKNVRYVIPPFQRPYVWEQEKQWVPLWDDVSATAESFLENPSDTRAHFFGAIVLQQQWTPSRVIGIRDVIDGQQRLTTLQLLLDAAQEAITGIETRVAQRLSGLVLNNSDIFEGGPDHTFKVWPTSEDRDAFRHAMHNDPSDESKKHNIVKAHDFFKGQAQGWIADGLREPAERAQALETTLTNLLRLVVIDLSEDDDPHTIFEVLNARGTPLLAADLIKNFLSKGLDEDDLQTHWGKIEEAWWREDEGRPPRPHIEVFLNHWIVMRLAKEVKPRSVYSDFRTYADGPSADGPSVADIAADIGALSSVYRRLQRADEDSTLGRVIHQWRGSLAPTLMWLLSSGVPEPQLGRCLRIIESFLTRRMIRKMTTANYNQLFLTLLEQLKENPIEQADVVIVEFLAEQKAWGRLWPDDREMEQVFAESPLYKRLRQWELSLVLGRIEERLRGPLTEETKVPPGLTIEHAMPQNWRAHWAPPPATDIPGEAEQQRDRLVHAIGNLTLVNQPLNSKLSDAPWPEKRKTLDKYSVLRLKDSLTGHDEWNEETIKARGRQLAKVAAEIWPHADVWRERLKA